MKHLMKALALGGALAALAPLAHADAISGTIGMGGAGTYTSAGVFTAGAYAYVNAPDSNASDSLSNFTLLNPGTFYSFDSTNLGIGKEVFSTVENGQTLSFLLTSATAPSANSAGYGFTGNGILSETGYDDTTASFTLNTNSAAGTVITFNAVTSAATPEPSSLILLGTGVLGAAGMLRRRFTGKSNA